jgi:hypothetical protein
MCGGAQDLSDLVHSFTAERPVFASRLRLMSAYPHWPSLYCLNPRRGKIRYNRSLMWHGMCLFLVGLLTGFGEHRCRNARSSMRWFWLIPTVPRRSRLLPAQSGKCHS